MRESQEFGDHLTKTYQSPPMIQKTPTKLRKVETGRFWSGHFLVVSPRRFFFRAATSWILGRASSQGTDGSKS